MDPRRGRARRSGRGPKHWQYQGGNPRWETCRDQPRAAYSQLRRGAITLPAYNQAVETAIAGCRGTPAGKLAIARGHPNILPHGRVT